MSYIDAQAFAQTWLEAWNAHDIDAVLTHFAINYRNQGRGLVNQVLVFNGGLVVAGFGTHRQNVETDNPAGVTA